MCQNLELEISLSSLKKFRFFATCNPKIQRISPILQYTVVHSSSASPFFLYRYIYTQLLMVMYIHIYIGAHKKIISKQCIIIIYIYKFCVALTQSIEDSSCCCWLCGTFILYFFFPFLTLTTLKLFWTAHFNERRILLRKYTESGFERRGGDTHICFILEISSLHQTLKRETHILQIRNKHEFFTLLSQIKLITPDTFL